MKPSHQCGHKRPFRAGRAAHVGTVCLGVYACRIHQVGLEEQLLPVFYPRLDLPAQAGRFPQGVQGHVEIFIGVVYFCPDLLPCLLIGVVDVLLQKLADAGV